MFMKKIGDLTASSSSVVPLKEQGWSDEINIPNNVKDKIFIKHIDGPLFFGSTSDFQQLAKQIPKEASIIILRLDKMSYMDQSGLYAMEDVLVDLIGNNKKVLLINPIEQPKYMLERIDIIPNLISENQIFNSFKSSMVWIKENIS